MVAAVHSRTTGAVVHAGNSRLPGLGEPARKCGRRKQCRSARYPTVEPNGFDQRAARLRPSNPGTWLHGHHSPGGEAGNATGGF